MLACIDLGSNSFHLLIGEFEDGRIQIVERCSENVQLGEDVSKTGVISPQAFQRGLQCLRQFNSLMAQHPLEQYWALGTNTFRVTRNAGEFIEAAQNLGIRLSTISGVQEAVLIYAGVITSLPLTMSHRLVVDIGGGSTEVIVGEGQHRLLTESLQLGSVAWRDQFFANGPTSGRKLEDQMDAGVTAAKSIFAAVALGISKAGWTEAYASSGTVKMLASICEAHGYGQEIIDLEALYTLKTRIASCIAQGTDLAGMKERRRDLLLAGWCVMVGLLESYKIQTINFSSTALREGMLDFMARNSKTIQTMERSNLPQVTHAKSQ